MLYRYDATKQSCYYNMKSQLMPWEFLISFHLFYASFRVFKLHIQAKSIYQKYFQAPQKSGCEYILTAVYKPYMELIFC